MAAILDTQRLVWRHAIHPDTALQLIASRSQKLSGAAGVAIALLNGERLEYKVALGNATRLLGLKILADCSSSFQQLRSESFPESMSWRDKVMADSVLSVPIRRNGAVQGCLQLFSRRGQFSDEAVFVGELMSTIINELLEDTNVANLDQWRPEGAIGGLGEIESQEQSCSDSSSRLPGLQLLDLRRDGGTENDARQQQERFSQSTFEKEENLRSHSANYADRESEAPTVKMRHRARTIAYPVIVIIFAVIVNVFRHNDWRVELATIVIVAFTAIKVGKTWSRREQS
jgi:hypothetical protein